MLWQVEVLTGLSVGLRREVTDFMLDDVKGEILSSMIIFNGLDRSVVAKLFLALTPHHFVEGDRIMEFGQTERNLFILLSGIVELEGVNGTTTLKVGASFGEMQFLGLRQTSVLTLTARSDCKVWCISRKAFHEVLDDTDDTLARIVSTAMAVYQKYVENVMHV